MHNVLRRASFVSLVEFDGNSYSDMSSLVSLNALRSICLISFLEASLK